MKSQFFKQLLCGVFISLLLSGKIYAQETGSNREVDTTFNTAMNHIFGTLDNSKIPFGLLRDYAMEFTNLESYNGAAANTNMVDKRIFMQIYTSLATARINSSSYNTLPSPRAVDSLWFMARQPGQVTLSGLYYQYAYLDPNAANNGEITVTNGQLFDKYISGVWQNPYLQAAVVAFAPAGAAYQGKSFNLVLPANLWLTNSGSRVTSIQVDAGDGLGYRTLTPGANFAVSYADTGLKTLNFKVNLTNSIVLQSQSRLHVVADPLASILSPGSWTPVMNHGFTSSGQAGVYDVTSTATYNGQAGHGIVSVRLGSNHTSSLTNPLIVSEGFDPGIYLHPENQTGEYTLADFVYEISRHGKLDTLILSQYDIVYIDFKNGTDDIHRNALIVEDVIRWVNANKTGSNKNVIIGQSMGGLCARYALTKMESGGETHQVRLFISQGVPEQGAVVPLGFQYLENHVNKLYIRAGIGAAVYDEMNLFDEFFGASPDIPGILTLTESPAAEQMLVNRINENFQLDNSVHTAWQSELAALGYPGQGGIRNIAISNGSECGAGQTLAQGGQLLYIDGKLQTPFWGDLVGMLGFPILAGLTGQPAFLMGIVPGRNTIFLHFTANAAADGGGQAYNGKISYQKTILWLIPVSITITNRTFNQPSGVIPLETVAGDYLPTSISGYGLDSLTKYGITFSAVQQFGFIPTASALDIGHGSVTLLESDYSVPYSPLTPPAAPKNTPFAGFITAYGGTGPSNLNNNEEHLVFEVRNGNWLTNELNGITTPSGCDILCSFNSISGSATVCTSPSTFSVNNNSAISYAWSTTSNMVIQSGKYTSSPSIAATSNGFGPGTVTLIISSSGCASDTLQMQVTVGGPTDGFTVQQQDPSQQFCANSFGNWMTVEPQNVDDAYFQWSYLDLNGNGPPVIVNSSGSYQQDFTFPYASTFQISATAGNSCGLGITQWTTVYVSDLCGGGFGSFVAYPNPAGNSMTISTAANPNVVAGTTTLGALTTSTGTPNNTKREFTYKLYNKLGKVLKQGATPAGKDAVMDTSDLPSDNYFLHIFIGKQELQKQIMVRH
jgi:hypothetical protein